MEPGASRLHRGESPTQSTSALIALNEQLKKSERKFRSFFDEISQFIALMTTEGTLVEINQTARNFISLEDSDLRGKPFWETPWWKNSPEIHEILQGAIAKAVRG